jgi:hypothetical protein
MQQALASHGSSVGNKRRPLALTAVVVYKLRPPEVSLMPDMARVGARVLQLQHNKI